MIDKCPKCGYDQEYMYRDYGVTMEYYGFFGDNGTNNEVVEMRHTRPAPVYAFCGGCGHRMKIEDLQERT